MTTLIQNFGYVNVPKDGSVIDISLINQDRIDKYGTAATVIRATNLQTITFDIIGDPSTLLTFDTFNRTLVSSNPSTQTSLTILNEDDPDRIQAVITATQNIEYTRDKITTFFWQYTVDIYREYQVDPPPNSFVVQVKLSYVSTPITSTFVSTIPDRPTIQVSLDFMFDFEDISTVTFFVNDDKNHTCVKSKYKQLISEQGNEIHVLAPYLSRYLAGRGDFSTQKMRSVNPSGGAIWPQVFLYAMAKFILNRLMNKEFCMDVVLRENTKGFLRQLSKSKYSNFVDYFVQNSSLERYFL